MIKEIKKFKRIELFEHYNSFDNPFIICNLKIDVTKIVEYCKKHKKFYATFGYLITKTINEIDAFKYRFDNEKIYYCDIVNSSYVDMYEDKTIGYYSVPYQNNFKEYLKNFIEIQESFKKNKNYNSINNLDEIWLSCTPWFRFESLIPTYTKDITIPQFIWSKYEKCEDKYNINLMILVHHGFADAYHIGEFVKKLEININDFDKEGEK